MAVVNKSTRREAIERGQILTVLNRDWKVTNILFTEKKPGYSARILVYVEEQND